MASQTLYRKWRSQTFGELVGQEHVVRTLRNAIVEGRVGHAYLFTGPRGVGKTSMARLLAKGVNCLDSDQGRRPCGACAMCQAIAEGRAVDVIEMDAASHTSVEDARELIERVAFRPSEARSKVYIIDETHMLSTAAFNALLKTLEEPPDHALFIMATTEVHKVPATILSRCQRFTFTRHSVGSVAGHLRRIASEEGLELEDGVAEAVARSATGSMRDALSVLEQLASFADGPIRLAQVQSLLGMTSAAEVAALIAALVDGDLAAGLRAVNGVAEQGADVRQFTRDLVERLRALLLLIAAGDEALADLSEPELEQMRGWAGQVDAARLLAWVRLFSGLDFQLRTTSYGHLPLELAVVEALVAPAAAAPLPAPARRPAAAAPPPPVPPRPTPARPAPARPAPADLPAADPAAAAEPPAAAPTELAEAAEVPAPPTRAEVEAPAPPQAGPGSERPAPPRPRADGQAFQEANADFSLLEQIDSVWQDVIRDVRPKSPAVQGLLRGVRPLDVEGNTLVLLAASPFHKDNLEKPVNRSIVESVIKRLIGREVAIRCTIEAKAEARDLRGQIREARQDELVRAAMNIFEAHIVDIEPEE